MEHAKAAGVESLPLKKLHFIVNGGLDKTYEDFQSLVLLAGKLGSFVKEHTQVVLDYDLYVFVHAPVPSRREERG